jgi:hypothetical protein
MFTPMLGYVSYLYTVAMTLLHYRMLLLLLYCFVTGVVLLYFFEELWTVHIST